MDRLRAVFIAVGISLAAPAASATLVPGIVPAPAGAPAIGFVGLISADLPGTDLVRIEAEVEASLTRVTPRSSGKAAVAASAGQDRTLAGRREKANAAEAAGVRALSNVDLAAAKKRLDDALGLRQSGHLARLFPAEYVRLIDRRVRLVYALRKNDRLAEELAREIPWQSEKSLDEGSFSPDVVAAYRKALASASAPAPDAAELKDLARAAGARAIIAGDVRRKENGISVRLYVAAPGGLEMRETGTVTRDTLSAALDRTLSSLISSLEGPHPASLTVKAKPWVEVWIDGRQVAAETPLRAYAISPGDHVISFQNPALSWKREQKLSVSPSGTTEIFVDVRADSVSTR